MAEIDRPTVPAAVPMLLIERCRDPGMWYAGMVGELVQATCDAVARDIARHGDVGAFIAGLPVVQTRINRHGRTVRFTV